MDAHAPSAAAVAATPTTSAAPDASEAAKGELLSAVFDVLDRDGLAYCVLHGYEQYPHRVTSDVDLLVPREMLPRRLGELLRANEGKLGARVVQWFNDRAHFIVLARTGADKAAPPVLLQLHVSTDYDVYNRLVYSGNEILTTRRPGPSGAKFWVPAGPVEFGAVLANKLSKKKLPDKAVARLNELWTSDPIKCSEQAARLLGGSGTEMVCAAAGRDAWGAVRKHLPRLRREMLIRLALRRPLSFAARVIGAQVRRVGRWLNPQSGLHVVFMGPDGAGKSTVIDAVKERMEPAFLHTNYQTFARGILPTRPKKSPHALPPRSLASSAVKAMWWLVCYTLGYYKAVYPTVARGGLAINHRYLLDALVDPKRYRYSGSPRWIRSIWTVAPKPDLMVFLDAPADVIHKRKDEVTLEEATRQRDAYLALAKTLPNAVVVSTAQPVEHTIGEVTDILLAHMANRVAKQIKTRTL
jgi:thymidylate kinase